MLGVLLRAAGLAVEYLGASLPVADVVAYARSCKATVVCFSTTREESFRALRDGLDELAEDVPPVIVGGRATGRLPASINASRIEGRTLAEAVQAIVAHAR
jgi:methanogenic corrinoid protein MtbC1